MNANVSTVYQLILLVNRYRPLNILDTKIVLKFFCFCYRCSRSEFKANNRFNPDCSSNKNCVLGTVFKFISFYAGVMMIPAYNCEGDYVYFVEVDFVYSSELHIDYQDLPLVPKKLVIQSDWLSKYCSECKQKSNIDIPKIVEKPYKKRVIFAIFLPFAIYLQFYTENGLQIANIHNALKMMQTNWL